jgi:hypothetical protein
VLLLFSDVAGRLFGLSAGNTGSRLSSVPLFPQLFLCVWLASKNLVGRRQGPIANPNKTQKEKKKQKFKNIAEGNTIKRSPLREPLLTGVNTSPLVLISLKRIAEPYSELCELYR